MTTISTVFRGEGPRPQIVCLCGSTRFYDEYQQAYYDLTMQGQIVLSVGFYPHAKAEHGHGEGVGHDSGEKVALDELHKRKIDLADEVLVLNVGGYIGESTRSEITYAERWGKPVRYLESVCDNTSVGVLIRGDDGRYLLFDRNTFPPGTAGAAGHVDDHGTPEMAAEAEVAEELGLTVTSLRRVGGGWRDNACRRHPGQRGVGHQWVIYEADATGQLNPSARETRNTRWLEQADLQELADRTAAYAAGKVSAAAFTERPGIEPVWVRWLFNADLVWVAPDDLYAIDRIARLSPGRAA